MLKTGCKLTVLFEEPFWVGIFEREFEGLFEVSKVTFGSEPKDYEIYDFLLKNYYNLGFSPALETSTLMEKRINPKRMRRNINKQLQSTGIGTKAQLALKLQQEQVKSERKSRSRKQRELEKEHQFELHQEKRKEKHRGH